MNKEYKEALLEALTIIPPKKTDWEGCRQIWKGLICLVSGVLISMLRILFVCTLPISVPLLTYLIVLDNRDRERQIKEWRENYNKPLRRIKK